MIFPHFREIAVSNTGILVELAVPDLSDPRESPSAKESLAKESLAKESQNSQEVRK